MSQVIKVSRDVKEVVMTADFVGKTIGPYFRPIFGHWTKGTTEHDKEQKLRENLGEWASLAKPKKSGPWLRPFLSEKRFHEYLQSRNGHLTPTGECKSNLGWAQLLYVLGITPESGIIDWRLPVGDTSPVKTGEIYLELPASVLWDIVNLYRLYMESNPGQAESSKHFNSEHEAATPSNSQLMPSKESIRRGTHYRFPFGTLQVKEDNGRVFALFDSKTATKSHDGLKTEPFICSIECPAGRKLEFPKEDVMTIYHEALAKGTSLLEFTLSTDKELSERVRELVDRVKELRADSPGTPYLLTPDWLQLANRIYRRATSDNSEHSPLEDDIIAALKDRPDFMKLYEKDEEAKENWEETAKDIFRRRFLFSNGEIRHTWDSVVWTAPIYEFHLARQIDVRMKSILEFFTKSKPVGSLAHALGTVVEDAKYLLTSCPEIRSPHGVVLEFTPSHKHWNKDCCIL